MNEDQQSTASEDESFERDGYRDVHDACERKLKEWERKGIIQRTPSMRDVIQVDYQRHNDSGSDAQG